MKLIQLFLVLSAFLAGPLAAQGSPASLVPQTAPAPSVEREPRSLPIVGPGTRGPEQLTAEDVNAWLAGFFPYALAKTGIPGAVVVVVKDGSVLTQRGFGYSDVAAKTPVDPARTLFRPGSVSKLFTWTAVMQLAEQGKLDLDQDVNTYLDFKIPPRNGKPITLRQIMKHTAGFEEQIKGIITTNPDQQIGFEALLKRWVPNRVYDPGTTPAYSNYATSLAGYIVQRVSGEPFNAYVERHIFQPLGMNNSTFRQPLPARLRPMMSKGYRDTLDKPFGFEFVGPAPAGSMTTTGADMGRFMIAHLQDGAFGANRILQPATARLMHRSVTKSLPALNGMALGFYEANINGQRVIAHGGDTVAFHSDLHLFLDAGVGLFVSMNGSGKNGASGDLRSALFHNFADRYFPEQREIRPLDPEAAEKYAQMLAGVYSTSRRAHSSFMSLTELLGQSKISVGPDGQLVTPFLRGASGDPRNWIAVGPGLWRDRDGHELLQAQIVDGKARRFSVNGAAAIMVWDRTPWYRSTSWLMPMLIFSVVILLLTALLWPVRAIVRRRFGATLGLERHALLSFRLSRLAALLILIALIGWVALIGWLMGDLSNLQPSSDPIILFLQIFSMLAFIGGFGAMLWNMWVVWRGDRRWPAKVWSVLLVVASATSLWVAIVYNLIKPVANY